MKKFTPKAERLPKLIIYGIALLASLVYVGYRAIFTLPMNLRLIDIAFGLLILAVELIEGLEFFVYFWNVLRYRKVSPKIPEFDFEKAPDVDVFVATLNESEELLVGTLKACSKMEYPDKKRVHIYLCDDGERDGLRKLAKKYGATYLGRTKHDYAKAGNYNYAMKRSGSPYIAIFDADMRPRKSFLMKTLPFFAKYEKVGFVQTPQSFKNPDIFQARFGKKRPFEQDYFYHYIQLARNNTNSVILCGTNCVIDRAALKSVGGFAMATIAEDVATGMMIEEKGYRGIAIDNILARGEAIDDTAGFLKQRSRWGRGCIQTAKAYGVFSRKNMSLSQKLDYFVAINYWTFGLKRLLFLMLPWLFACFGVIMIQCDLNVFLLIFGTQYILKRFVIGFVEGRYKSSTWTKVYELIQAPYLAGAILKELLGFSDKKFIVTEKGGKKRRSATDWKLFLIHFALFALNAGSFVLAYYKMQLTGWNVYIIPMVWMAVNAGYLMLAMLFDFRKSKSYRNFEPNKVKRFGLGAFLGILWRGK